MYYPSTKDEREGVEFVTKVNDILDALPSQIFPGIFIFLASVRDVLFYFLKFLKKLKKNRICRFEIEMQSYLF